MVTLADRVDEYHRIALKDGKIDAFEEQVLELAGLSKDGHLTKGAAAALVRVHNTSVFEEEPIRRELYTFLLSKNVPPEDLEHHASETLQAFDVLSNEKKMETLLTQDSTGDEWYDRAFYYLAEGFDSFEIDPARSMSGKVAQRALDAVKKVRGHQRELEAERKADNAERRAEGKSPREYTKFDPPVINAVIKDGELYAYVVLGPDPGSINSGGRDVIYAYDREMNLIGERYDD